MKPFVKNYYYYTFLKYIFKEVVARIYPFLFFKTSFNTKITYLARVSEQPTLQKNIWPRFKAFLYCNASREWFNFLISAVWDANASSFLLVTYFKTIFLDLFLGKDHTSNSIRFTKGRINFPPGLKISLPTF